MLARSLAFLAVALLASEADADPGAVHGEYDTPLGRIAIAPRGDGFVGRLVAPSSACRFAAGDEVLRATLLDDSLAGELRVCVHGKACRGREAWASAVLLVSDRRLAGAVHLPAGCLGPVGKGGGVAFERADGAAAPRLRAASGVAALGANGGRAPSPAARRARAREVLRDGAAWLAEGNFEAARRRFLDALEIDPGVPEAYNGVGVTYRMRDDHAAALEWYKKALATDPDFGDAYYNMACVYALRGDKALAFRYLQIAALNGYASAEGIGRDPDLSSLHGEPAWRALVRARM